MTARCLLCLALSVLLPLRLGLPAQPPTSAPLQFSIDLPPYQNALLRQDDIAAHLVLRSGTEPRLIAAFPAGDSGVGVWFDAGAQPLHWRLLGTLQPLRLRDARGRTLRGFSVELSADQPRLRVREALLSSVRVLRTYESEGRAPAAVQVMPVIAARRITWSRDRLDGAAGYALTIEPLQDGRVDSDGAIISPTASLHLRVSALTGEQPLRPLDAGAVLQTHARLQPDATDSRAVLSFLSYQEKFLAGSWRFDTYFGRDTLMSLLLLLPALQPEAVENGLRSVLQRLSEDGEVAHEEAIGEYAILSHRAAGARGAAPIYDYGMVDESFMLAPLAARYLLAEGSSRQRAAAFLASPGADGRSCGAALVHNLLWVVARTAAFAQRPLASNLIGLKAGHRSGDWRDSPDGLDGGLYPYDVNVALVPAALQGISQLLDSGLLDPYLSTPALRGTLQRAAMQRAAWQRSAPPQFRVSIAAAAARAAVTRYAGALGVDAGPALSALSSASVQFDALALDAQGQPLPVMHSDEGFTLLLDDPAPELLERSLTALLRPFPAGLMTPVGLLVADAAYAGSRAQASFSSSAYHGAVVWSWQEALMIAGIDRQLRRRDLPDALRTRLEQARAALWHLVDAVGVLRSSELWSWSYHGGHYQVQPFQAAGARDESDAVQLWSTVFLGLKPSASR